MCLLCVCVWGKRIYTVCTYTYRTPISILCGLWHTLEDWSWNVSWTIICFITLFFFSATSATSLKFVGRVHKIVRTDLATSSLLLVFSINFFHFFIAPNKNWSNLFEFISVIFVEIFYHMCKKETWNASADMRKTIVFDKIIIIPIKKWK